MQCYECARLGTQREAVGICNECSAGLCVDHAAAVGRPVTAVEPINRVVVLPLAKREILCPQCKAALEQLSARATRA